MPIDVPYLQKRGKVFRYRRAVPKALRTAVGVREWLISFPRRTTPVEAIKLSEHWAGVHDAIIASLEAGEELDIKATQEIERRSALLKRGKTYLDPFDIDEARGQALVDALNRTGDYRDARLPPNAYRDAVLATGTAGGKFKPSTMNIKASCEAYLASGKAPRSTKPIAYAVEDWIKANGNTDFALATVQQVEAFIEYAKRKNHSGDTIKRRIGALRGLERWVLRLQHKAPNPLIWSGHKIETGGNRSRRYPFHHTHLKKIDAYIAKKSASPSTLRMLRIMRLTGMGPSEVAGIVAKDVAFDDPMPRVIVRPNEARQLKGRDVKAQDTRARIVPLIGDALEAMKEALADPAGVTLFCKTQVNGNTVSAVLNQAIRAAGVPKTSKLSAYSFRHTFSVALEDVELTQTLVDYVLGHAQTAIADNYRPPVHLLARIRDKMIAAAEVLGRVDELNYREEGLI